MKYQLLLLCLPLLFLGCSKDDDAIQTESFRFESSQQTIGCGDFFVFQLADDLESALLISGNSDMLEFSDGFTEFDLANTPDLEVRFETFNSDASLLYCNDVLPGEDFKWTSQWKSISGKAFVLREKSDDRPNVLFPLINVTVRLENVVMRSRSGELFLISEHHFDTVLAGWSAG